MEVEQEPKKERKINNSLRGMRFQFIREKFLMMKGSSNA